MLNILFLEHKSPTTEFQDSRSSGSFCPQDADRDYNLHKIRPLQHPKILELEGEFFDCKKLSYSSQPDLKGS